MVCLHPRHRPKGGCHREIIVPRLRIPVSVTKTKGASSQRGYAFVLCGRWDLNPHEHTPTRSLVLPVCQFQHSRLTYGIISRAIFKCNPFFQKSAKFFGKSFQNFSKKWLTNGFLSLIMTNVLVRQVLTRMVKSDRSHVVL